MWAGSMITLHNVWYSKTDRSPFHVFDDSKNWLQMDKIGHVYTAYKINETASSLFKWTGLKPTTATLIGSLTSFGYQSTLELFDAYSEDWGFSWADMASNCIGTGLYAGQDYLWGEQKLLPKFSYHPTEFAQIRPEVLGSSHMERLLKDYNGQTYWISFSPGTLISKSRFPKWLCFSFGYSVDSKLVGDSEVFVSDQNGEQITYQSSREYLFSMDLDLSKIPVKKKWLSLTLKQLNHLKIPFPALRITNGHIYGSPLYF